MAELNAGDMAQMIEEAVKREWSRAYPGNSLSDQGKGDRAVLFAAIAQGVLGYLQQNLKLLETTEVESEKTKEKHKHNLLTFDLSD